MAKREKKGQVRQRRRVEEEERTTVAEGDGIRVQHLPPAGEGQGEGAERKRR